MKEEYKILIKEDITRLLSLHEEIVEELQERVIPSVDFPSENYDMTRTDINDINKLRNKEVAIGELIHFLDKELNK